MLKFGLRPDALTFHALIHACAKVPDSNSAEYWLMQMREASWSGPSTGLARCRGLAAKSTLSDTQLFGDLARAQQLFDDMDSHLLVPNLVCFNTMLNACVHKGDSEAAEAWFHKLEPRGIQPNSITLNRMISVSAKSGDEDAPAPGATQTARQSALPPARALDAPGRATADTRALARDAIVDACGQACGQAAASARAGSWRAKGAPGRARAARPASREARAGGPRAAAAPQHGAAPGPCRSTGPASSREELLARAEATPPPGLAPPPGRSAQRLLARQLGGAQWEDVLSRAQQRSEGDAVHGLPTLFRFSL
ncbi:unnamed protein product [Prorocentrum cordatum]|uniref:Pentatricopeptide repeat-containing protein n=1 Tax=Prorocentrum cordatum TaxID=2364126 RepID=A0ABN9R545_9DINO|nr:unnamed protein product [Polarella glacialis]